MPPPTNPLLRLTTKPNLSLPLAPLPLLQTRHESTARRHRKLLTLPEAPSYTPTPNARKSDKSATLIFNPPSSAPSPYHTPAKFLPPSDKRSSMVPSALHQLTHAALRTGESPTARLGTPLSAASLLPPRPSTPLPAPVRTPYEKKYHLTQEDVDEMRRLRAADPDQWTRVRLAEKFGCSQFFVGMVAKNEGKAERVEREHQRARERWGNRKRMAREDRERRKEGWGRDA